MSISILFVLLILEINGYDDNDNNLFSHLVCYIFFIDKTRQT